jgi:putative endonuclease
LNPLAPLYRIADGLRYRKHGNLGQHGEDLAHRHLRRNGFIVVARNWRPPQGGGEIDIVAWEGDSLVFIEVKTRASAEWSAPERDIDGEKIHALRRAARDYVRRSGADDSRVRFDAIAITGNKLVHLRDAFSAGLTSTNADRPV